MLVDPQEDQFPKMISLPHFMEGTVEVLESLLGLKRENIDFDFSFLNTGRGDQSPLQSIAVLQT